MPSFIVRWEIEVDADTPAAAVETACEMLPIMGNDTTATVFHVWPAETAPAEQPAPHTVDVTDYR